MTQRRIPQETAERVAELWDREAAGLMRYAMVLTGGREAEAGDLVQQAFMAAARDWETLGRRGPDGHCAWLRVVCRRRWIDGIRRAKRLEEALPELSERYSTDQPDPADVVVSRAAVARCWEVICALSHRRRQVAVLHFYEGYSAVMIAELLDIRPSGVRKHITRAREVLRREVGPLLSAQRAGHTLKAREGARS
ncbi:RNA polymerase sigma factor [Streptomyces sp. NPDC000878]